MKRYVLCFPVAVVLAMSPPASGFELNEALRLAVEADPALKALSAQARAFEAEAVSAGQLPDPQLTVGLMNVPAPQFSLNDEPMAQAQLGLIQRFPARARREAMSAIKSSQAETVRARRAARKVELKREVRLLWTLVQRDEAMLSLERDKAEVMDQLTETLDARLEVDLALQTAVLSSRARRARLEKTLVDRRARLIETRSALAERLDPHALPARLESARFSTPAAVLVEDHPRLFVAHLGLDEAERQVALADAAFRPGWSLNVNVGRRFGDVPMGAPSDTLINATVAIDLPLFTRNRQSRDLEAARERFDAAATGPEEVRRTLSAEYRAARQTRAEYARMIESYLESVLPLARDQEEAAELRYSAGRGPLEPVLEARLARLDTEIEVEQLRLARDRAAVELLYLAGE